VTASRRLVAILAVDVVGYSRLMGQVRGGDGAACAHAGKMDEAKAELAEARRLNPAITIKWVKEHSEE
jgi:class 3 adenylate cyclase